MLIPIKFLIDRVLNFLFHIGNFGKLSYQTILAFGDIRTYCDKVIGQMMNIGIRSLPVVGYISVFMGM
ncbi:MAG: hypothetical protein ACE5I1_07515, partial [bacterium]